MQVVTHTDVEPFFNVWQANAVRIRMPLTMIFIAPFQQNKLITLTAALQQQFMHYILHNSRQTDMVFYVENDGRVGILLTQSTAEEASAYLKRLAIISQQTDELRVFVEKDITFKASIAEIRNDESTFQHILATSYIALYAIAADQKIVYLTAYQQPKIERVKISIIEDTPLMQHILYAAIKKLPTPSYEKDIALFTDGEAFLHSDFYYSAHKHIIITQLSQ